MLESFFVLAFDKELANCLGTQQGRSSVWKGNLVLALMFDSDLDRNNFRSRLTRISVKNDAVEIAT